MRKVTYQGRTFIIRREAYEVSPGYVTVTGYMVYARGKDNKLWMIGFAWKVDEKDPVRPGMWRTWGNAERFRTLDEATKFIFEHWKTIPWPPRVIETTKGDFRMGERRIKKFVNRFVRR